MVFKNRRLKLSTAIVVLLSFGWMSGGGNAWAEAQSAERDPAKVLRRLADDPRLALSQQEKEYIHRAADRIAKEPRTEPLRAPMAHVPRDAAREMQQIASALGGLAPQAGAAAQPLDKKLGDRTADLAGLKQRLQSADQLVLAEFADTEARVRAAHLPQVILERHAAARASYRENIQAVFQDLDTAAKSDSPGKKQAAIAAAAKRLSLSSDERPRQPFDPKQLPFRTAKPVKRKPGSATVAPTPGGKTALRSVTAKVVQPTPADLAANEDAQITPEIQALATSLGNRPLAIYEWVRNNVEFVPTYGSVQGSQMTLDTKRGNAFDTASLLIALLRAAHVPARYVTGTVQVPIAPAMNWVGGAESPSVAQQLLGQGGVPNVGLTSGVDITALRIDHVWVEAFVHNIPSRGAVQGPGDTWLPMDPSFKLHQFTPRSDLFTANPVSAVLQPGDHLFDVDESLGKITNVDDTVLQDRLTDWASRSDQYILTHGVAGTMAGLLGGQTILQETTSIFPASLPYRVVTRGTPASTLPASLRHSVTLNGFNSDFDRAAGNAAFSVNLSLPTLNSRRLSIEFDPATQADADTLAAARSGGASSLPVYLVNVLPTVKLDGVAQGTGSSVRMGSFFSIDVVLQSPEGPTTIPYQVVAGDAIVAGVTGNGITREILEKRFAANPVNNAPEYLHQVQLHYWAECDYLGQIAAKPLGVHMLRLPSVGFFSSPLTVSYLFGSPRSGVYESRIMDVKQSLIGAAGSDPAKVIAFVKQSGIQGSYLEGSVFDQLENRPTPASKGISSIHLLSAAAGQGIPIYRITSANASAVLPLLQLSSAVESDISTAVSQGKTVLAPERNVNLGPWSGAGYIIQDEATGAGAYLISGGANGGGLLDCIRELVPRFIQVLLIALLIILLILLIILLIAALAELIPVLVGAGAAAAEGFAAFLLLLRGLGALSFG